MSYGWWRQYYGLARYGESYITNPVVSVRYEELYDAIALHDVKDLAVQLHIKAKHLIDWYEKEFDTAL